MSDYGTDDSVVPPPADLIDPLSTAVRQVGALLREWRADPAATDGGWQGQQFKAHADGMAHEALTLRLHAITPGLPVISEEDPESLYGPRPAGYWLIDPIDGTASYAHGFAGYVTQAALIVDDTAVVAAIYAPEFDIVYAAMHRGGATANGVALPAVAAPLEGGIVTDNTPEPRGIARAVRDYLGYTGYLECGSIALKLCRIAEGAAHLFVKDVTVRDWDVAAPGLILAEVGGWLRRLDGTRFSYRGDFAHTGLIAAADAATCAAVAAWYSGGEPAASPAR
ncbi:3'(2'),5'-bisphosphate nucleotidase CysQ family protein [Salinactinospora qingdaonensis]|uniref:inositol-phosphate phosphatase n=1 Tax=Salinactinospora qingdaonensis TaxID=702744 RepID=A0ABP7ERZ5_9ACTN